MSDSARSRVGALAPFLFALAALAACWAPISAPFALVVGLAASFLAVRAIRRSARRRLAVAALVIALVAFAASAVRIILTASAVASPDLPGEPVVQARSRAELDSTLDDAAARTRAARERAKGELPQK